MHVHLPSSIALKPGHYAFLFLNYTHTHTHTHTLTLTLTHTLSLSLSQCTLKECASLVSTSIRDTSFRSRFGAAVVAVRRDRKRVDGRIGDIVLQPGDQLVLDTGVCHCFF